MKICDVTQSYAPTGGGVRTYLHAKRRHLLDETDDDHVLIVPGAEDSVAVDGRATTYTIASPIIPGSGRYRLLYRSDKVVRILRSERPDVIESQCAYNLPWTALYHRRRAGCVVVGSYLTDLPEAYVRPGVAGLFGERAGAAAARAADAYIRALYRRFDATTALSPAMVERLRSIGIDSVHYVPLGVDLDTFHPSKRDGNVRRELGAAGDELVLIYAGRLDSEKRPIVLVDAFDRLPRDLPVRLVLVGDGPGRDELADRARRDERIRVLPFERDRRTLATLLASADVYVSAMPHETFGLSVVEAQAAGLPVLGVRSGAMVDRVPAGTGELVPPDSPPAFAERIAAVPKAEWRRRGAAARRHVERTFSWRRTFSRLFAVYRDLCGQNGAGSRREAAAPARPGTG